MPTGDYFCGWYGGCWSCPLRCGVASAWWNGGVYYPTPVSKKQVITEKYEDGKLVERKIEEA